MLKYKCEEVSYGSGKIRRVNLPDTYLSFPIIKNLKEKASNREHVSWKK